MPSLYTMGKVQDDTAHTVTDTIVSDPDPVKANQTPVTVCMSYKNNDIRPKARFFRKGSYIN